MAIDYKGTVARARAQFDDQPPSARRGWQITNQTVLLLHQQGETFWGLFSKPSGTNWNGYSIDIVMHEDGHTFDCLGDAEGAARPQWNPTQPTGMGDPAKWRPPVGTVITPDPGPEPPAGDYITRAEFETHKAAEDRKYDALKAETLRMFAELEDRVAILESGGPHPPVVVDYKLVADASADPIQTSREWGHGHEIRAAVIPK